MENNQLRAGAGKAVIRFPVEFFPQENFSGVHDDIYVRIIILECEKKIAFVSLELTSLPEPEVNFFKNVVNSITGIEQDDVWIMVTHSFSSPHFLPPLKLTDDTTKEKMGMLRQSIMIAVQKAADYAAEHLEDAQIGLSSGECDVNINRDVLTDKGWWIGSNPEGSSDKTLTVIRVDKRNAGINDAPIAILFNYNVQSSIMDGSLMEDGTKKITSDLVGKASDTVEQYYDAKTVAMFLIGAAGDQAPRKKSRITERDSAGNLQEMDLQEKGYEYITELGMILGKETLALSKITKPMNVEKILTEKKEFKCPGQKMPENIHILHPTFHYEFTEMEARTAAIEVITIGNMAILGTKPELNDKTAREIKKASPFPITLVTTMLNGGAKYMADTEAYDKMTYESMNSSFAKGSAEVLAGQAVELLGQMKK